MIGLLKTLFFFLLFYYVFKILVKMFAPFLVKKVADKMKQKAEEQFTNQEPRSVVKEGETIIDKAPSANKQTKNSVGEYVDFEEIE